MESGVHLGLGEGPLKGPMSQPRGNHWSHITHAGSYLRTECAFCSQLYSGIAKGDLIPHIGGTETHWARPIFYRTRAKLLINESNTTFF